MFNCVVLLFAILTIVVFSKEIGFSVAQNSCSSNKDCRNHYTCCRGFRWYTDRSCRWVSGSCRGRYCFSNSDCNGQEECCVSNRCTNQCPTCSSIRDCDSGKYCCFTKNNQKKRCEVNCLGKYCSNKWSCGGSQECCRSNVCVNCTTPGCRNYHECHKGQSCCKNKGIQGENFCATRCVDAACLIDSDCDRYSKCCHDNKCVSCVSLECSSNSQCSDGYCCDRGSHRTSRCFRSGCVGESCDSRSDCGGPNECCIENKCVKCPKSGCRDNWECPAGKYCCKGEGQGLCSQSCVGKFCRSNKACSAPGECCINHECTALNCTCRSKYDCRNGFHCCRSSGNQGYCRPNCTGMKCKLENDCSPAEICTYPDRDCVLNPSTRKCSDVRKCFSREGCFSHNDCNSFGIGYYCCRDTMFFSRRSCYSNCINKICTNDSDCGGAGECCDSKKKRCLDCPKTPNDFPVLAILFIVVGVLVLIGLISWYVRCKVCRPRNTLQRSTEPSPTAQQEIQATPSWSTETENGNGQFNVRNTDDRIYENDIGLPSAPPMELYENPSTLNLPPPPSYESLFPNR